MKREGGKMSVPYTQSSCQGRKRSIKNYLKREGCRRRVNVMEILCSHV
jgi:hypothetical protein